MMGQSWIIGDENVHIYNLQMSVKCILLLNYRRLFTRPVSLYTAFSLVIYTVHDPDTLGFK
ncbi:hypothetical protein A4R26_24575 [Niastella populi]|uniref:Uncharacterized protein n=1 Tax=Niastella populi TaxID=550983 RepID=A0A1V9FGB3_9BACT|nr:hypothetical protein A4R26_24575 [Niastella populi]